MREVVELICRTKPSLSAEIVFSDGKTQHFYGKEAKEVSIEIFKREYKSKDV